MTKKYSTPTLAIPWAMAAICSAVCSTLWLSTAHAQSVFSEQEPMVLREADTCSCNALTFSDSIKPNGEAPKLRLDSLVDYLGLPEKMPLDSSLRNTITALPAEEGASSLEQMALYGMGYSLDVEGARQRLASFQWARDAAAGSLLPKVTLRSSKGEGTLRSDSPDTILSRDDTSLTLIQPIIDLAATHELKRQNKLVGSAEYQLDNKISTSLLEISNAYLTALQANVNVRLGREYELTLNEMAHYIGERAKAGGASQADYERVRSRVANIRGTLANDWAVLKSAVANLARLSGHCPQAFDLKSMPQALVLPISKEEALDTALQFNPELQASRAEVAASESERDTHANSFMPKLTLDFTESETSNIAGTSAYSRDSKVMLTATINLFNGGIDHNQYNASQARTNELLTQSIAIERKLDNDLNTAYFNLYSISKRFETVSEEVQANSKVVTAFKDQLSSANRQLLDVLDAHQRLYQSKLDLLQNVIRQAQTYLQIAHLTGTLKSGLLP